MRQRGYALVVEGYMDVVALAQSGFGNAVATLGTACTAEHVQKLFRFTDSVVFSFDGDAAGRRAAGRALEASLPHASDTRSFRFLFLPPEHDPDSYVRELGAEAFEQRVAAAVPLSQQIVAQARRRTATSPPPKAGPGSWPTPSRCGSALPEGMLKRQLLGEIASPGGACRPTSWRRCGASAGRRAAGRRRAAAAGRMRRRTRPRRPIRQADPPAARPASPGCCCSKAPGGTRWAPPTTPCSAPCPAGTARLFRFIDRADRRARRASPGRRCASASPASRWGDGGAGAWSTARIRRSSRSLDGPAAARWRSCAVADLKRAASARSLGRAG